MEAVKKIAVFTSARSEYGSFRPLLSKLRDDERFEPRVIVSGTHLSEADGATVGEIEADGFPIFARIPMFEGSGAKEDYGQAVGRLCSELTAELARNSPDLLLVNGDRVELLAVGIAATLVGIPIGHIAGGEITEGAFDDPVRHAMTKLAHLHFTTNPLHAQRIRQLGEEPWRVHVAGEPALDLVKGMEYLSRSALESSLGLCLIDPVILVTFHPETRGGEARNQIEGLVEGMERFKATYVITHPNADPGHDEILSRLREFVAGHPDRILIPSLGQHRYYSMMKIASAMLGNSSSGLWEAPSFELPVVNIGCRQKGRLRAANVVDVPEIDAGSVVAALEMALSPGFRGGLAGLHNPYGNGDAACKIVDVLASTELGAPLLNKKFVDSDR